MSVAWTRLKDRLVQHGEREYKDGPGWSPTRYASGATRAKGNVLGVSALVLDVDHHDLPYDQLDGYAWVAHTTYSHDRNDPRWRVVVPLSQPVSAHDWPEFISRAYAHFGGVADEQCKDASRFYYLPSHPIGAEYHTEQQGGRALDPDELPPVASNPAACSAPRVDVASLLDHGAPEGRRDTDLFRLACKLRRADVPYDWACILIETSARNCAPAFEDWRAKVDRAYGRYQSHTDPLAAIDPYALDSADSAVWRNKHLRLSEKKLGLEVMRDIERHGDGGEYHVPRGLYAYRLGVDDDTITAAVKGLVAAGLFSYRRSVYRTEAGDRGGAIYLTPLYSGGLLGGYAALATAVVPGRKQHGGKRERKPDVGCASGCDLRLMTHGTRHRHTCGGCGEVVREQTTTTRPYARRRISKPKLAPLAKPGIPAVSTPGLQEQQDSVLRLEVLPHAAVSASACPNCKQRQWWRRSEGGVVCGVCHPQPQCATCRACGRDAHASPDAVCLSPSPIPGCGRLVSVRA